MADYTGTVGNDTYAGTNQADTISGGDGNDTLSGGQGADTISGDAGNDILSGEQGNDTLNGGTGNDTLDGGVGDDTLTGSAGDDILTGGNGDDTFNYSFTMETSTGSGPQSYAAYLDELGLTLDSQNVFSTTYTAWLNYLVFGDGEDWQGLAALRGWEGDITVGLNQNDYSGSQPNISVDGVQQDLNDIFGDAEHFSWTKGKATQDRTYWDLDSNYDWGGGTTVSSTDGKDTITDFKAGDDMLFFTIDAEGDGTGLTNEEKADLVTEFKSKFDVTTGEFGGNTDTDTKMVLDDGDADANNDMSITLLGYNGGAAIWDNVDFAFV